MASSAPSRRADSEGGARSKAGESETSEELQRRIVARTCHGPPEPHGEQTPSAAAERCAAAAGIQIDPLRTPRPQRPRRRAAEREDGAAPRRFIEL
jgi:hypothetical protein